MTEHKTITGGSGEAQEIPSLHSLENNLDRQLHWIKASEDRLIISMPIAVAMLAASVAILPTPAAISGLDLILLVPAIVLLLGYFILAFLTIFPEIRTGGQSVIYFGDIADGDRTETVSAIARSTVERVRDDLAFQIYVNATIARKKYELTRVALLLLFLATPLLAASIYFHTSTFEVVGNTDVVIQ